MTKSYEITSPTMRYLLFLYLGVVGSLFGQNNFDPTKPHYVESYGFANGNFISNWNFENDVSTWTASTGSTVTRSLISEVIGKYDKYAMKVTIASSSAQGAYFEFTDGSLGSVYSPEFFGLAGRKVLFSAWVKTASGQGTKSITIGIEGNGHKVVSVGEQWTKIEYAPYSNGQTQNIQNQTLSGSSTIKSDSLFLKDNTVSVGSSITLQASTGILLQSGFNSQGATVSIKPGVAGSSGASLSTSSMLLSLQPYIVNGQAARIRGFITLTSGSGTFFIDGVVLETTEHGDPTMTITTSEPRMTRTYQDGMMRSIQTQAVIGDSIVVATSVLDKMGRMVASPLPIKVAGNFAFINGLTDANFSPGNPIGGLIGSYYANYYSSADGNYAYGQTVFRKSPLNDVETSYGPGNEWRSRPIVTTTSIENGLYVTTVTDENGVVNKSYTDGFDNTTKVVADDNGLKATTLNEYDASGRLLRVVPPKANQDRNSPLVTEFRYNNAGWVMSKITPDEGKVENRYDNSGNLVYSQDAKNRETIVGQNTVFTHNHTIEAFYDYDPAKGTFSIPNTYEQNFTPPPGSVVSWSFTFSNNWPASSYGSITLTESFTVRASYNHNTTTVSGSFTATGETCKIYYVAGGPESPTYTISGTITVTSYQYPFKVSYYDKMGRIIFAGVEQDNPGQVFQNISMTTPFDISAMPGASNYGADADEWKVKYYYDTDYINNGVNFCLGKLTKIETNTDTDDQAEVIEVFSYDGDGNIKTKKITIDGLSEKICQMYYNRSGELLKMAYQENIAADDYYEWYEYDQLGRNIKTFSATTNQKPSVSDVENKYFDARGLNLRTVLGGTVQGLDYRYNIRGWLTNINDPSLSNTLDPGKDGLAGGPNPTIAVDKFGIQYGYGNSDYQNLASSSSVPETWSGNIRYARWAISGVTTNGNTQVGYAYQYDNLSRLMSAQFKTNNGATWSSISTGAYNESLTYDLNGNILTLTRRDQAGLSDNTLLNYQYITGTNKLINTDGSGTDFTYDNNGNMLTDVFSGVTMTYDFMDMPVTLVRNGTITTYSYHGSDRVKKQTGAGQPTYYVWGMAEYAGTTLSCFNSSFGKVINDEKNYFIVDAVGSVRAIINTSGTIVEYSDYYAFGNLMSGRSTSVINADEQFNSKKLDVESGYLYYGDRYYNARISRWMVTDVMDETHSPYSFSANNPISVVDINGEFLDPITASIIIAAIKGAAVSAAVSTGSQLIQNGNVDWGKVGKAAAIGAITGGASKAIDIGATKAIMGTDFSKASSSWEVDGMIKDAFKRADIGEKLSFTFMTTLTKGGVDATTNIAFNEDFKAGSIAGTLATNTVNVLDDEFGITKKVMNKIGFGTKFFNTVAPKMLEHGLGEFAGNLNDMKKAGWAVVSKTASNTFKIVDPKIRKGLEGTAFGENPGLVYPMLGEFVLINDGAMNKVGKFLSKKDYKNTIKLYKKGVKKAVKKVDKKIRKD